MKYDFIYNPAAGKYRKVRIALKNICKMLDEKQIEHCIHRTNEKSEAKSIVSDLISNGSQCIVAVGGDGTVNEVLSGFHSFESCSLGIIPCGSGNDFAKCIGLSCDPIQAMNDIMNKPPRYTDFIQLTDSRSLNVAGTGIDVNVLIRYAKGKILKGKAQYFYSLLRTVFKFTGINFECVVDGVTTNHNALIAAVSNGQYFGGGIQVSPNSVVDDGKLNLIIINNVARNKLLKSLSRLMKGKVLELPETTTLLVDEVKITAKDFPHIQCDGELKKEPLHCKVVTGQLRIHR